MKQNANSGYDVKVIDQYREKIIASSKSFILDEADEHTDEYAHFYFIGKYEEA